MTSFILASCYKYFGNNLLVFPNLWQLSCHFCFCAASPSVFSSAFKCHAVSVVSFGFFLEPVTFAFVEKFLDSAASFQHRFALISAQKNKAQNLSGLLLAVGSTPYSCILYYSLDNYILEYFSCDLLAVIFRLRSSFFPGRFFLTGVDKVVRRLVLFRNFFQWQVPHILIRAIPDGLIVEPTFVIQH